MSALRTTWSVTDYRRALRFAADAHGRTGVCIQDSSLPYVVHVVEVAAEVIASLAVEPVADPTLAVVCALLHDTLEDTDVTDDALRDAFGDAVARGVRALSKDASLAKSQQMSDSLDRILACPPEIARVKLADRIVNLSPPPSAWSTDKIRAYQSQARDIAARLRDASPLLYARLSEKIEAYEPFCER
ncbi:MAG: HD domain-containing protein [Deltaproteobacteria bacterium]|nr:HD domain-containing protein [Deltaproteobacteria bacterium]